MRRPGKRLEEENTVIIGSHLYQPCLSLYVVHLLVLLLRYL